MFLYVYLLALLGIFAIIVLPPIVAGFINTIFNYEIILLVILVPNLLFIVSLGTGNIVKLYSLLYKKIRFNDDKSLDSLVRLLEELKHFCCISCCLFIFFNIIPMFDFIFTPAGYNKSAVYSMINEALLYIFYELFICELLIHSAIYHFKSAILSKKESDH